MVARRAAGGVLACLVACTLDLQDPAGRACDEGHPCAGGRVCASGVCTAPGAVDAGNPDVSAPAADASTPNLHPTGTFEAGCGGWSPQLAEASGVSLAHGGTGACRVCSLGSDGPALDDKGFLPRPEPGRRYRARAWVRLPPGQASLRAGILLRTVNRPEGPRFEELDKEGLSIDASQSWTPLDVTLSVTRPADVLNVVAFGESAGCFLVDDVSVELVP